MEATIASDTVKHYPVLLKEIISVITPQHGGTFIDCTFGQGGYTKEILKYQNTKVIGLDRDIKSELVGKEIQKKFPDNFLFKNSRFSKINNLEGWGELSIHNLKKAIEKSKVIDLGRFIFSIGIRHIGQENAKILAGFFMSINQFSELFIEKKRKAILGNLIDLDGIGETQIE